MIEAKRSHFNVKAAFDAYLRRVKKWLKAISLIVKSHYDLADYVRIDAPTVTSVDDLFEAYPLYWIAENIEYYGIILYRIPFSPCYLMYGPKFATLSLNLKFEDYFEKIIKSAERALIRKAIKNGFYCKEINYDEYLGDVLKINVSKEQRGGKEMSDDYINPRRRDYVVKKYNPNVYTFGCFNAEGTLVAYYMFEEFTNYFHTVKGIGHYEYLSFGIMNYLFAYSVGELREKSDGNAVLIYGVMDGVSGLSKFKKHAGLDPKYIIVNGNKGFYQNIKAFNNMYCLHGDAALNLINDYA